MARKLDQLPQNNLSSDCIILGEENSTTSVKVPVNAANGLAGLDANAQVPTPQLPRAFGFFIA
jgi:hypothetical protein